jgi:hypothetical protein
MPDRWCTVTVTDAQGRRHSIDVFASSTYDAAHQYVANAKAQLREKAPLPDPTMQTVFEVVAAGKVYRVAGEALQRWIEQRRSDWKGPKGALFRQRPGLR